MFTVIMAGGSGTRFWPRSRRTRPKQFLNICGRGPMVVETSDRLAPIAPDKEQILVLGAEHLAEAQGLFGDREVHLLAEPVGRNTAPCIGLGAVYALHLGCREPIAFLPADHFIGDVDAFLEALKRAADVAASGGIATLGIVPSRPETGYGYIQRGAATEGPFDGPVYRVSSFVEKPELETAVQYLASGDFYWNGGIFVANAETILSGCRTYLPNLYEGLIRLQEAMGTDRFDSEMKAVYETLDSVSFDYGIMEKTDDPVFVVPCECGWSDVGSWTSLYALREADRDRDLNLREGEVLMVDSRGNFVSGRSGRLIACLGLKNCLVVDTPDALLVADMERSQEIRKIVDRLESERKEDLL